MSGRAEWIEQADEPFAEPWQARAFALAVLTCERLGLGWDQFRDRLKEAVAEDAGRAYYDSWTVALERLVAEHVPGASGPSAERRRPEEGATTPASSPTSPS